MDTELGICLCLSTEQLPSICARHADDVQSNIRVDDLRWTCCGHLRSRRGLQIILHSSEASRVLSAECRVGDIFVVVVGSIWVLACAQDMTARYRSNHAMERTADRGTLHSRDDFHSSTPSDARPRPPSLILFSLDGKREFMAFRSAAELRGNCHARGL